MAGRKKKHKGGHDEGGHVDERWLLTYADLITLLMSLFMVLWSISSVNISKYEDLQRSLSEAFSGHVMPGGQGIKQNGGSESESAPQQNQQMSIAPPQQPSKQSQMNKKQRAAAAKRENQTFKELEKQVRRIARENKVAGKISTTVSKDGLHIRITTDDLLFASGSAEIKPQAKPLLKSLADIVNAEATHQVVVKGHTDNVPIKTGRYHSNWNLSSDRAANVVISMVGDGVAGGRLTSAGRADMEPMASNSTPGGRSLNRRVKLRLARIITDTAPSKGSLTDSEFPTS